MTAINDPAAEVQAFLDAREAAIEGNVDAFDEIVPPVGNRPGLTVSGLRAVLTELEQRREYVTALNEAQVGLQTSAFKAGWWSCRDAVTTNVSIQTAEAHALNYAEQVRAVTIAATQQPEPTGGTK